MNMEKEKLIEFYFHPGSGDSKKTIQAGCRNYTATLITHRSPPGNSDELWAVFNGPNRDNAADLEHCWSLDETEQIIQDAGVGQCGFKPEGK